MINHAITLIHYGELSLKGKNRTLFENKLSENIERVTGGKVTKYRGRFVLEGGNPQNLKYVFGISWYSSALKSDKSIDSIEKVVLNQIPKYIQGKKSFGVFVKRPDKSFPYRSMEIERVIGEKICRKYNLNVDLKAPDISVFVEIAEHAYIYFNKTQGIKGLPIDVSGHVLSLLSGGIDSPVSSYLMMKRGCRVNLIHFHVFNDNKRVLDTKMSSVLDVLNKYQGNTKVFLVPYYPFEMGMLRALKTKGHELVLFRRFMVKIAEKIAVNNGCKALVTGDSLGQVASQTMENIAQVTKIVSMPIFQPLIAYDKQEIIDLAKQISTYDISIEKYKDCCSIVSSNPRTKANSNQIQMLETTMNIDKIVDETLGLVTVIEL